MDKELLDKVKQVIYNHPGGTRELCDRTKLLKKPNGYSMRYIQYVLTGDRDNPEVIDLAIKLFDEIIKEKKKSERDIERKEMKIRKVLAKDNRNVATNG